MIYFILGLVMSLTTFAQGWDSRNNPFRMDSQFQSRLDLLPLSGEIADKRKGWPAAHWANNVGGISHRWSSSNPQNFSYKSPTLEELKGYSSHQINELSPAEKFDIFRGDYTYPTVKRVMRENSPFDNPWFGICHGVAPAALNYAEPKRVQLVNKDGIEIDMYSSDVAALISYFYAKLASSPAYLVGRRCSSLRNPNSSSCADINPGSFHIIMANKLGLTGESFIADIDRFTEVWNNVAIKYNSELRAELPPSNTSARGTVKRITVVTNITYTAAIAPKFDPVIGTDDAYYSDFYYEYNLDLNKRGEIIGGEWLGHHRPDFLWTQRKAEYFGIWKVLDQIYYPTEPIEKL